MKNVVSPLLRNAGGVATRDRENDEYVKNDDRACPPSRWASGPDNWILTSVAEVYGVWNLATNYHGAYFLSFLQPSSLFQAPIQAGLAPDCVEETLYFINIYFS